MLSPSPHILAMLLNLFSSPPPGPGPVLTVSPAASSSCWLMEDLFPGLQLAGPSQPSHQAPTGLGSTASRAHSQLAHGGSGKGESEPTGPGPRQIAWVWRGQDKCDTSTRTALIRGQGCGQHRPGKGGRQERPWAHLDIFLQCGEAGQGTRGATDFQQLGTDKVRAKR